MQPYKYNGKEFIEIHGYDTYDFGWRGYHAAKAQFDTPDKLAEDFPWQSQYVYAGNNPVRYEDTQGLSKKDKVKGAAAALLDNASGGFLNLRGSFSYDDARDYNSGQNLGDALSIVAGYMEAGTGGPMLKGGATAVTVSLASAPETAGGSLVITAVSVGAIIGGAALTAHGTMMMTSGAENLKEQKGRVEEGSNNSKNNKNNDSNNKGTLSGTKKAVKEAQDNVGGSLPKGEPGKKGSPQRGDSKKGYRLDPGHPNRPVGDAESGPHVNWWDYTNGKRGTGGQSGAIPIE